MSEFGSVVQATSQGAGQASRTAQVQADVANAQAAEGQAAAEAARTAHITAEANKAANSLRGEILRRNGVTDAQPGVSVTTDGNGTRKTITYPDGKGGTGRIVVGDNGITVDGQPMTAMDFRNAVPTGAVDIVQSLGATLAVCVVGFPLARAFGRWLDRRGSAPRIPAEVMTRLSSIENAVETVAVEVERISEGQRFMAKLLNERASRDLQAPVGAGDRAGR
jgi:hypothetical protein